MAVVTVVAALLGGAGGGGVQPVLAAILGGASGAIVQPNVAAVLVVASARQRGAGGRGFHAGAGGFAVLWLPENFGRGIFSRIIYCFGTAPVSQEDEEAPLFLQGRGSKIVLPRCLGHGSSGSGGGSPFFSVVFSSVSVG